MQTTLRKIALSLTLIGLFAAPVVHAATLEAISVQDEVDGNFMASLFHAASASNAMGGAIIGDIDSGTDAVTGTYDQDTGWLDITVDVTEADAVTTNTMQLRGFLDFDTDGWLENDTVLNATFGTTFEAGGNAFDSTNFLFLAGEVCGTMCANANNAGPAGNAPNSMVFQDGGWVLTLWGANGGGLDGSGNPAYIDPNLGMDLRVTFTPVPIPATALLVLPGLLVIRWLGRKRRT